MTPLYLRTNNTLTVWFDANNTITINGADATRIMAYINEMTGGSTGMASATVRRS